MSLRFVASVLLAMAAVLAGSPAMAQPAPRSVAMTFDDLPFVGPDDMDSRSHGAAALRASKRIQAALRRHAAPATGFVNEDKVQKLGGTGIAILRSWNRGAFELGNHGFAHVDSNSLSLAEIEQEVVKGERTIRPMIEGSGRRLRFFRFPYNHVGDTEERRVRIEQLLAARGYQPAASTIDTSDYVFARAYERAAARKDAATRRRIEQAYLDHTRQQIEYYASLNAQVLGYQPPQILLLHLNSLNAAVIEPLLRIFESLDYRFVSLAQAQSDPAYQRPPAFATKFGPMWGYRWARERGVKVDGSLEKEPPIWVAHYAEGRP
ncbi:MAG: polysaccharide deacetylase family protein [Sphingomonas bacterium]